MHKRHLATITRVLIVLSIMRITAFSAAAETDPKKLAQGMAQMSVQAVMQQGGLDKVRVPQSAAERAEVDAACTKGPKVFMVWVYGPAAAEGGYLKDSASWKSMFGDMDPPTFCHALVEGLAKAKSDMKSSSSKGPDAQLIASQLEQWKQLDEDAKSHNAKLRPGVRWPKNAQEQAELNKAARTGTLACDNWISPKLAQEGQLEKPFDTKAGISAEDQCNQLAMQLKWGE